MPNLEMARAEIKRVETILRSRYNYAHPVFDHLAVALEALQDDLPETTPPTKKAAKSRRGKVKRTPKVAAEAPAEPGPEPEGEGEPTVEAESAEGGRYEQ